MSSNTLTITNMPDEVILHLIKFLPHSDRCALREVCSYFNKISHYYSWLHTERFIVKKNYYDDGNSIPHITVDILRPFISILFDKIDFTSYMFEICIKLSTSLRDLTIIKCDISERDFTAIISCCSRLESLSIISCSDLLMSGSLIPTPLNTKLPELKSLVIENCNHMTDSLFTAFLIMCPNISALGLRLAVYNFHPSIYKRFYNTTDPLPSSSVFTIEFLLAVLIERASLIKSLDFSFTFINDDFVERLCTMKQLRLNSLNLGSCYQLRKNDKKLIGSWQPYIIKLNISDCFITDYDLLDVCLHMTNLQTLNISKCSCLTELGIKYLQYLKVLKTLHLSHNTQITGEGLVNGLCKQVYPSLVELNVKSTSLQMPYIKQVLISFPNLCVLNLQGVSAMDDALAQLIFKILCNLKEWYVSDCSNITNEGITGIPNHTLLENLLPEYINKFSWITETITINNIKRIMRKVDSLDLKNLVSISSCVRLTHVDLSSCVEISDKSLILSFNLTDLRVVDLSSTKITSLGISYLAYKCSRIEQLNINNCDICDLGVTFIVKNLRRLTGLHLRDCCKLTNITIEALAEHGKVLRFLDLSGYNKISKNFIRKLKCLTALQEVRFRPEETHGIYFPPPVPPLPSYSLFS